MSKENSRFSGPWFHGSPKKFEILDEGSWVTPYKEIAKAFSHKPTRISISGDTFNKVKHNGMVPGFLYIVDEEVEDHGLVLLQDTDETHWQTQRTFRIKLVAEVPILESELLTTRQVEAMEKKHPGTGYWRD